MLLPKAFIHSLCALSLAWISFAASAAEDCERAGAQCVEVGVWEVSVALGLGGRTNPVVNSDHLPILVMPSVSYYGKRFFLETDTLGFTLFESQRHMLNAIGTVSYDQIYFNEWGIGNFSLDNGGGRTGAVLSNRQLMGTGANEGGNPREEIVEIEPSPQATPPPSGTDDPNSGPTTGVGAAAIDLEALHKRHMAGLLGLEYAYEAHTWRVGLQALQDASGVHHGKQVRAAASVFSTAHKRTIGVSVGAEWKDSNTLDYYYGVRADEVGNIADAYYVGSGISYHLKFDWMYRLSRKWDLQAVAHYRWLPDTVRRSPLVEDDASAAVFLGGVYHF